ncbi:MAG: hypothetical protein LBR83_05705 [Clostridiales bacterium]|nr:hypothetical protein [Clostridiales bacterium]
MGTLIILSGPSGVGKGPMTKALELHCESTGKKITKHVLYNNRAMRKGEADGVTYHFVSKKQMISMRDSNANRYHLFYLSEDKEKCQMLDKEKLSEELNKNDLVLLEILPTQTETPKSVAVSGGHVVREIFISPLSDDEFKALGISDGERDSAATAVMLTKLINRDTEDWEDQLKRAKRAADEIKEARMHSNGKEKVFFINHFGEDNRYMWDLLHDAIEKGQFNQADNLAIFQTFKRFINLVIPVKEY